MWFVHKRRIQNGRYVDNGGIWEIVDEPTGVECGDVCRI